MCDAYLCDMIRRIRAYLRYQRILTILIKEWEVFKKNIEKLEMQDFYTKKEFALDPASLEADVIDLAYNEGKEQLASTLSSIDSIQSKIITFLGWLLALEASLVGVLVSQFASEGYSVLSVVMNIYGVLALSVPALILVYGSLYRVEVFTPGDYPSHFLDTAVLDSLKKVPEKFHIQFIKGWKLREIQEMCEHNASTLDRLIKSYRRSLISTCVVIGVGVILFFLLVLFL